MKKVQKILKKNFFLDKTIGFNNFKEGLSGKKKLLPKKLTEKFYQHVLDD